MERIGGTAAIMGGTRPYEEIRYQSEYVSGLHDRWVPDGQWGDHEKVFARAGIRVLFSGLCR